MLGDGASQACVKYDELAGEEFDPGKSDGKLTGSRPARACREFVGVLWLSAWLRWGVEVTVVELRR